MSYWFGDPNNLFKAQVPFNNLNLSHKELAAKHSVEFTLAVCSLWIWQRWPIWVSDFHSQMCMLVLSWAGQFNNLGVGYFPELWARGFIFIGMNLFYFTFVAFGLKTKKFFNRILESHLYQNPVSWPEEPIGDVKFIKSYNHSRTWKYFKWIAIFIGRYIVYL